MGYDRLVDRLASADSGRRVTTFPDGSVDTYVAVSDGTGGRIETREAFGRRIAAGERDSFPVERDSREPGGQAVQMARQTHALGEETTCFGHLDDPAFEGLPFGTVSMGEPSSIRVFSFADDDLLLTRRSAAVENWSLADLTAAGGIDDPFEALAADAVCCGNWASVEGLTDALATLADASLEVETFVLDPGPVSTRSPEAVVDLLEVLGDLEGTTNVVYSVNRTELEDTVDAIEETETRFDENETAAGGTAGDDPEHLALVRETAEIGAAVLHETDVAAVATPDGTTVVENLPVDDPRRRTGAGDRFSAALAVARVRDWQWETALALGNCCASYYVETAETGDRDGLRSFLGRKTW